MYVRERETDTCYLMSVDIKLYFYSATQVFALRKHCSKLVFQNHYLKPLPRVASLPTERGQNFSSHSGVFTI